MKLFFIAQPQFYLYIKLQSDMLTMTYITLSLTANIFVNELFITKKDKVVPNNTT